jgi:hypothetical protein
MCSSNSGYTHLMFKQISVLQMKVYYYVVFCTTLYHHIPLNCFLPIPPKEKNIKQDVLWNTNAPVW